MTLLESNYYAWWLGKQTAKGTPNAAPSRRPIMVGGNLAFGRDDGEENYSDLTKYGAKTDWVNSLTGGGEPACEATPTELAYALWLMHGAETVSAITAEVGPPAIPVMSRHRYTPSVTMGHWFTSFLRVGSTVLRRHQYNDCIISRIAMEASTANKAMRFTPSILSLDPGIVYAADPAAALPTDRPFLHTDLSVNGDPTIDGSMVLDGVTYRGTTQWNINIDDAWSPVYGDDQVPYDFQQGTPTVTVGCTILLDALAMQRFNALAYGDPTPSPGMKPLRSIPALGSMLATARQRDSSGDHGGREFVAEFPGIKWTLPDAPAPNPSGGATEFAFAGEMRPVPGEPAYTIDVYTNNAVVAFTT